MDGVRAEGAEVLTENEARVLVLIFRLDGEHWLAS
jgi:hypothetical protein